ncbi:MAG: hypothetical protein WB615_08595 [Candidatus Tumulicola sp.]
MVRSRVFAIAAACAFALAGCSGQGGYSATGGGSETVDDAAAIVAHRPTGSQNAAAAIGAVDALGSLVKELADADGIGSLGGTCRGGSEFFAPSRDGDPRSTELREFFDAGCTHLARDAVRVYRPNGSHGESEAVAVSIYAPGSSAPIALRLENSQITNATFGALGFPIARYGFVRTTVRQLLISNQRQSVSSSETIMLPSRSNDLGTLCQNSAGYNAAGIPSLDATFGWQGATVDSPTPIRRDDGTGVVTVATTQVGDTFAGPVGSLSLLTGPSHVNCAEAAPAYAIGGGTTASAFRIPVRAAYRHGRLASLAVSRATFSGGYRFDLATARNPRNQTGAAFVSGVLANGRTRVATLSSDEFGSGELTITSTGAQYRLVDWTVVL